MGFGARSKVVLGVELEGTYGIRLIRNMFVCLIMVGAGGGGGVSISTANNNLMIIDYWCD